MRITVTDRAAREIDAQVVVVPVYEGGRPDGAARDVDGASAGTLSRLVESREITGKHGETTSLLALPGVAAIQTVVVGLGDRAKLDPGAALRAYGTAARAIAGKARKRVAFYLPHEWLPAMGEAAICGAALGCHGQDLYRTEPKTHPFEELLVGGVDQATIDQAEIVSSSINLTRRLVNEPASEIYPETFATAAQQVARENSLEIEVWDEKQLLHERCGSLLAVAQGSSRPPRMVILSYRGGSDGAPWLGLVGKGVTFDSGGLSLKPTDGMKTMKCDMAGAATVLGAIRAIAQLRLPVNVLGLMGLVENMVSGASYKLGDVLKARNGKSIEVLNTDAEGRLVLADVLDVAVERGVAKIIDLATLTGACLVALGTDIAGVMTNDQAWSREVIGAAGLAGELVWELPMFSYFNEQVKSDVADIKNVGDGRWGGAITAAKFLEEFVAGKPWVHLDIAGPAFLEKPKPWLDGGGSGAYVRTLVEVAKAWK